jgi:hypothetical protein
VLIESQIQRWMEAHTGWSLACEPIRVHAQRGYLLEARRGLSSISVEILEPFEPGLSVEVAAELERIGAEADYRDARREA